MIAEQGEKMAPVWGCVLIGGRSRRMGAPKHLLDENGLAWIEQTVAILRQKVERVVICGAGEVPASLADVARVDDIVGLSGPLAGILAAFRGYPQVSWLVAACDLPDMEGAALQWLLDCRRPGVLAVMPELAGDGRIEPLLAYYDRACRPLLEEMATAGYRRMNRLQAASGVITPQPPLNLRSCWRNVNTPDDLGHYPAVVAEFSRSKD
jgi:molybdopterin-guanine dinucleotide biosynthesis protein A